MQEGSWRYGPLGAVLLVRYHSQLDLLSPFMMSKTLILTFLFAVAEVPWKTLSVRLWVPDQAALSPGEEWIRSWGFCQLLSLDRVGTMFSRSADDGLFSQLYHFRRQKRC